jgi:hypothetical protein
MVRGQRLLQVHVDGRVGEHLPLLVSSLDHLLLVCLLYILRPSERLHCNINTFQQQLSPQSVVLAEHGVYLF